VKYFSGIKNPVKVDQLPLVRHPRLDRGSSNFSSGAWQLLLIIRQLADNTNLPELCENKY